MAEKKKLTLSGGDQLKAADRSKARKNGAEEARARAKTSAATAVADEDDEDEDPDILSDVPERGKNKNTMLFAVIGAAVVVVVVFLFLILGGGKDDPAPAGGGGSQVTAGEGVQSGGNGSNTTTGQADGETAEPSGETSAPNGVGTQDFTGNTNMTTSDTLTDPDKYIEDLYGLTTRVDYTVNSISNIADFVSYEKHRGTWGGGLELYWLDATYKNNHYVIQVPFKYYKELDDVGIVPVRMEVLTINGSSPDEKLTVISYMCLDEEVLADILKNQAKAK